LAELAAICAGEGNTHVQWSKRSCFLLADDLCQHRPQLGLRLQVVEDLANAGVLHDIGIMHIPDSLLNKRGRLSAKAMQFVRGHSAASGKFHQTGRMR